MRFIIMFLASSIATAVMPSKFAFLFSRGFLSHQCCSKGSADPLLASPASEHRMRKHKEETTALCPRNISFYLYMTH